MKLIRCNRCGAEKELPREKPSILGIVAARENLPHWSRVVVTVTPVRAEVEGVTRVLDLCEDCREVLLEQFMSGAAVAPITQPLVQTVLPHQPMTDCMLVWDPERGGFLCEHDDSQRYHRLCRDQAQNAAEGVPPQDVQDAVDRLAEDMHAAENFATVQRCGKKCSEAHTYKKGCLLASPAIKARGKKGDGDNISQHGEDLTAAYSEQEPAEDETGPSIPEQRDGGHNHE